MLKKKPSANGERAINLHSSYLLKREEKIGNEVRYIKCSHSKKIDILLYFLIKRNVHSQVKMPRSCSGTRRMERALRFTRKSRKNDCFVTKTNLIHYIISNYKTTF